MIECRTAAVHYLYGIVLLTHFLNELHCFKSTESSLIRWTFSRSIFVHSNWLLAKRSSRRREPNNNKEHLARMVVHLFLLEFYATLPLRLQFKNECFDDSDWLKKLSDSTFCLPEHIGRAPSSHHLLFPVHIEQPRPGWQHVFQPPRSSWCLLWKARQRGH